jgi:uncharacterized metal-binding protein
MAPISYTLLLNNTGSPDVALNETALLVGAHLLSGIMFSPDLDIDSSIDNRWGIFYWIWRPYMWAVPHRRWVSHGLVISPVLRLIYFFAVIVGLLAATAWLLSQVGVFLPDYHIHLITYLFSLYDTYPREVRAFLIGFITGSAAHTIADWLVTNGKGILRIFGIRITRSYANHDFWPRRTRRRRRARA